MSGAVQAVAHKVVDAGGWPSPAADSVTLDYHARYRRRLVLTCQSGRRVLLDLPEARLLAEGDGLVTDEGDVIEVRAAPEPLAEIRCDDPHLLLRIAWHLGNRHLPTELRGDCLRIRADHVIVDMARKLGAQVTQFDAPFNPEGGAYGHGTARGHRHHGHEHDDDR